jgi:hypothetical protein
MTTARTPYLFAPFIVAGTTAWLLMIGREPI